MGRCLFSSTSAESAQHFSRLNGVRQRKRRRVQVLPAVNTPALAPLANASHAVVLSPTPESAAHFLGAPGNSANIQEYWRSLRPRPARFSPANRDRIYGGKH